MAKYRCSWFLATAFICLIECGPFASAFAPPSRCPYSKGYPSNSGYHYGNRAAEIVIGNGAMAGSFIPKTIRMQDNAVQKYNSGASINPNMEAFLQNYFENQEQEEELQCFAPPAQCGSDTMRYRTFNGACNNLNYPGYGAANSRYTRMLPPVYGDGTYAPTATYSGAPLPNARQLSLTVFGEDIELNPERTVADLYWGQITGHDLTKITSQGAPDDCCSNANNKLCYPIELHPNGPIAQAQKQCLHFARAISDFDAKCSPSGLPYAEKLSLATAYMDMSFMYGNSIEESNELRTHQNGQMLTSLVNGQPHLPLSDNENGECGADKERCFKIPERRNEVAPSIAALHTIWVREHNRIANILHKLNPHYTDEILFQEARKLNIAQYQKITYYDWLPLTLGEAYTNAHGLTYPSDSNNDYINDYDDTVNVAPFADFVSAAFRYAHNQIPDGVLLLSASRSYNQTLELKDLMNQASTFLPQDDNLNSVLRALSIQQQKAADGNIAPSMKHFLLRKPNEEFGSDLKALDIQRGRDFGLPSYNDFRQLCGLPRAHEWADFANELTPETIEKLRQLYATPDDVELNVGGAAEQHVPGAHLGPTFQCIIGKQFLKTRVGDRFFFERPDMNTGFTREQLAEIRKTSLASIICQNSDVDYIQLNVFLTPSQWNTLRSCHHIPAMDLRKWQSTRFPAYSV